MKKTDIRKPGLMTTTIPCDREKNRHTNTEKIVRRTRLNRTPTPPKNDKIVSGRPQLCSTQCARQRKREKRGV